MARGFGTGGLGTGSTDLVATTATTPDVASFHVWIYWRGQGGGNFGRIFDGSAGTTTGMYCFGNGAANYSFNAVFSGGFAAWTTDTAPTGDAWEPFGVAYDPSSTANDPTVFQNGSKKTIGAGLTEATTPSGTYVSGGDIHIGNRADFTRNWDGILAEFAVWNALLTDDEFAALAKGLSPLLIRPSSLVEYVPMVRDNVSYKRAAPTITATAVQPHPRIIMPRRRRPPRFTVPIPPEILFAQACL